MGISKTLTKVDGGTVESYRFAPVEHPVARTWMNEVVVENRVDGELLTRRGYSLDGASALQSRLKSVGFKP